MWIDIYGEILGRSAVDASVTVKFASYCAELLPSVGVASVDGRQREQRVLVVSVPHPRQGRGVVNALSSVRGCPHCGGRACLDSPSRQSSQKGTPAASDSPDQLHLGGLKGVTLDRHRERDVFGASMASDSSRQVLQ